MAKIIYACSRKAPFGRHDEKKLRKICRRLEPDHLTLPVSHRVSVDGAVAWAIVNDRNAVVEGNSVLLGCLYGNDEAWHAPKSESPDGSYALFRNGSDCLELVSDATASRTIWYCFDDERFVASTSQRAIVMFLGRFEFNEDVIPWMLSTGSLGPQSSWDKRIKRLPPDSSLILDKQRWSVTVNTRPVVFAAQRRAEPEHKASLLNELRRIVRSLKHSKHMDFDDCVLPLSGGYDSRAILCLLAEGGAPRNLRTVTWGLEQSIKREGNDAALARELAGKIGVKHRYFHTDVAAEPMQKVIDRFIACAEGRIDHVGGYMDGLETWRKLLEEERCRAIIRGDEGFGWVPVSSELSVRLTVGMGLCADYRNLDRAVRQFKLPQQTLPAELQRRKGETLSGWRDRLYHAYRMPTVLAALTDIKCSYVEVINPLLARSILRRVRELPDHLRTDKRLFREIVRSITPPVAFASEGAIARRQGLLRKTEIVEMVRQTIGSDGAKRVFSPEFLAYVLRGIQGEHSGKNDGKKGRSWDLKSFVPRFIKEWIRERLAKPSLDGNALAFRVFLILKMHEMLHADSTELAETDKAHSPETVAPRIAAAA